MTRPEIPDARPPGHVLMPAATIGALSILLAAGLGILGVLGRIESAGAKLWMPGQIGAFPKAVPAWLVWLSAILLAFALAVALLNISGTCRRVIVWISAVVLVAGWTPVLCLAARSPDVGAPLVAVIWSGLCASVYCRNHRMPADEAASAKNP